MDAWDLVMRALSHYWRVTRQDNVVAQALLEKAIALDPELRQGARPARHQLHVHRAYGLDGDGAAIPVAERAARAAIRADDEDAWAHNALGHVYLFARRFDDSLAEFETALRLNPNFALAQGYYGLTLGYCGRWQDADAAARRAIRLSPRDPYAPVYFGIAAYARFLGGDYEEAIRLAQESLRQRSDFVGAHRVLTAAAGMAGHDEIAARRLKELPPRPAECLARLDHRVHADQARLRPRALSRRLSPGWTDMSTQTSRYPLESTMMLGSCMLGEHEARRVRIAARVFPGEAVSS